MNIFGENMQELRKDKGITQDDLALILNVSKNAISSWERGIREPNTEMQISIAKALDTTVSYLIGETNISNKLDENTPEMLYAKLIAENPEMRILFHDLENFTEHDYKILQETIEGIKARKKLKELENK